MPVRLVCTCGNQLWIPDEHAGRQVKCPKCGTSLVAPSGPSVPATASAAPPLAASRGRRRGRAVLFLALAGLLLVGAAASWWFFFREGGPVKEGDDLALIPANAQGFVCIHLADLWQTPAVQKALENARTRGNKEDPAARMENETGLRPEEVERLSLVGVDADRQIGWAVTRTLQPYNRKKILSRLRDARELSHQGERYYLGTNADGQPAAVYFAGTHVVVAGTETGVKRCLDATAAPGKGPLEPVIAMARSHAHTAVAGANPRGGPHESLKASSYLNVAAGMDLITATLDISDKVALDATAQFPGEEEARETKKKISGQLALLKIGLAWMALGGGEKAEVVKALNDLLGRVKFKQQGKEITATARIDEGAAVAGLLLSLAGQAGR